MSDGPDEKLESILRSRRVAAASSNLAERIILKAQAVPQLQNASLWWLVQDLFAEFHLPKPAFVLAGALALGMIVGFTTPWDNPGAQYGNAPSSSQGLLSADEGLL